MYLSNFRFVDGPRPGQDAHFLGTLPAVYLPVQSSHRPNKRVQCLTHSGELITELGGQDIVKQTHFAVDFPKAPYVFPK